MKETYMKKGLIKTLVFALALSLTVAMSLIADDEVRAAESKNLIVNGGGEEEMLGWVDTADPEK